MLATLPLLATLGCSPEAGKPDDSQDPPTADSEDTGGGDSAADTSAEDTSAETGGGDTDTAAAPDPGAARGTYDEPTDQRAYDEMIGFARVLGDLDGDGVDEVAVAFDRGADDVAIVGVDLYGGAPTAERWLHASEWVTHAWPLGDGRFAVADAGGAWFFEGLPPDGAHFSEAPGGPLTELAELWPTGDVDGDGELDFAASREGVAGVSVFRGPPPAGPIAWESAWATIEGVEGVDAHADLDGDGTSDLVDISGAEHLARVVFGPIPAGPSTLDDLRTATLASEGLWGSVDRGVALPAAGSEENAVVLEGTYRLLLFRDVVAGESRGEADVVVDAWSAGQLFDGVWASDGDADGRPGLAAGSFDGARNEYGLLFHDLPGDTVAVPQADAGFAAEATLVDVGRFGGPAVGDLLFVDRGTLSFFRGFELEDGEDPDRDGWSAPEDGDDHDPSVHPYAAETADGRDEDCDGTIDENAGAASLLPADPPLVGDPGAALGSLVAAVDADGDGANDLAATDDPEQADPTLWIVPHDGTLADAIATRTGTGYDGLVAPGDCDGDGQEDLLVAGGSDAWLLHGPFVGDLDVDDDPSASRLDLEGWYGVAIPAAAGDLDGDGLADVGIGNAAYDSSVAESPPVVWVFSGADLGADVNVGDAAANFVHAGVATAPLRAAGLGDVDGDGYDDVLVSDATGSGLWFGPVVGTQEWGAAPVSFDVGGGPAVRADAEGDGVPELWIARAGYRVHAFAGPFSSASYVAADAYATVEASDGATDFAGAMLAADLDGDGADTVLVGGPGADGPGLRAGRVYAFEGALSGTSEAAEAAAWMLDGASPFDHAGGALAIGGFLGDGTLGIAVGVPGHDAAVAAEGAVAVVEAP